MRITLILAIITAFHMASSAPPRETLQPFELAMLDKLHQPWNKPVKHVKHEYPRKGETMCKGGPCRVKENDCEDCQYAAPVKFKPDKVGLRKV